MTITGIFPEARNTHLTKDVGEIGYCLHKKFGLNAVLAVKKNDSTYDYLGNEVAGLRLDMMEKGPLDYLLKNSKKIDILYLFHFKKVNFLYFLVYKLLNPSGVAYLKLDCDTAGFKGYMQGLRGNFMTAPLASLFMYFAAAVTDLFSIETLAGLSLISSIHPQIGKKLAYIPNGIDASMADKAVGRLKTAGEKENTILTVGRIGTNQKNSEMLLKAAEKLEFKGWKIYFVGPIEDDFKIRIEEFYRNNPGRKDDVVFTGPVEKKDEIYDYYNRAKIFVLTSEFEGFPIVFPEALYFANMIVTTDVGPALDVTDSGRVGTIIKKGDHEALARTLQEIIDDPQIYPSKYPLIREYSGNFTWDHIATMLHNALDKAR